MFDDNFILPILSGGAHADYSEGKLCAAEYVGYMTGEIQIQQFPSCAFDHLAEMVQWVNDRLADTTARLIPAEYSMPLLDAAWLIVGTAVTREQLMTWPTDIETTLLKAVGEVVLAWIDQLGSQSPVIRQVRKEVNQAQVIEQVFQRTIPLWPLKLASTERFTPLQLIAMLRDVLLTYRSVMGLTTMPEPDRAKSIEANKLTKVLEMA